MFKWFTGNKSVMEVLMRDSAAPETLIWQHPSTEFNTNSRVNLNLNEVAVFYDMTTGTHEIITESKDLKTGNIPVLSRIPTALSGGVSKYQCRVYFIRTSNSENLLWGTPQPLGPFKDWIHKGMTYSLTMNGVYNFKIVNVEKMLQFVDSDKAIDMQSFEQNRIYGLITGKIYQLVSQVIDTLRLDFISTREFLLKCGPALSADIQSSILDDMGLKLINFSINSVALPDDPNDPYVRALALMTEEAAMVEGLGIQGIQNYVLTHSIRMAEAAAANGGAAGASAGIGIGAGVGAGIGGQLGNMINSIMSPVTQQMSASGPSISGVSGMSPVIPGTPGANSPFVGSGNPNTSTAGHPTPQSHVDIERLNKLKQLFDMGIITQAQYDSKVAEILQSL